MKSLLAIAAIALAATAHAQNTPFQGFLYNWDRPQLASGVSFVTRGTTSAEQVLNRIDRDDYRDWGLNAQGQTAVQGFLLWIQDSNDATRENYGIVGYGEDPARPNFPLVSTPVLNIANIPMPATGTPPGPRFWRVGAGLTTPATFTSNQDIFLGVSLPAMVSATDGLWVGVASADTTVPGVTTFDLPGPRGQMGGGIAQQSYLCFVINGNPVYATASATSLAQLAMDWMVAGGTVGGVALTQTNQTSYPSSNGPLGTSNMLSGLHPDINGSNPGRADDIGFAVMAHTGQVPVGQPVFMLMALGPNPLGSLPVSSFPAAANPGSAGNVCLDFTNSATFLGILAASPLANMAETQVMVTLSPQTRAVIASMTSPVDLWWQGFALDSTATGPGLEVRATGCVIQHLK